MGKLESRNGDDMPAGAHKEDKDHGPLPQTGPSDFTIKPKCYALQCYYDCIGHLGQYDSLLLFGVKTKYSKGMLA